MKLLAYFRSLAAKFLHRDDLDDEVEEELRSHIQSRADDLERSGLSRAEAERRAGLEFGAKERVKEEIQEALGGNFLDTLLQDVRVSLRVLRKSPGFLTVTVLTLALGIGANAVVFSVINAFILHPLNVPKAESLYQLERGKDKAGNFSYPDYLDLRDRNRSFDGLIAWNVTAVGLDTGKDPYRSWVIETSGNYFDALGIQPYLGRLFHGSDEHGLNSAPYAVLSYECWHTHFHDDPGIVGRTIQLSKQPFTVLGVAPPDFHGVLMFFHPDLFVPIINREQIDGLSQLDERGVRWVFMVMGHLKPGVTRARAIADLNSIGSYLEKSYPKEDSNMTFSLAKPSFYGDYLGPAVQGFLAGLMLLAGLILLAACANLGSLFAARAADRAREVALRLALGSSRTRILRQVFTEAVLISLIGGAVGLWGSVLLLHGLSAWRPFANWPIQVPVNPDANVYLVALLLALVSGFLFGAVPVRQILRTNAYEIVKGSSAIVGQRITVRDLLLVVQIAICAVLVTSSMVAVRGLVRSLHNDFGFNPENAMLVDTDLMMGGYRGEGVRKMQRRMIEVLQAIPGVESVGLADSVPLSDGANSAIVFTDKTTDLRPANAATEAAMFSISPDYFRADGTSLLSGRTITWHDDKPAPRVAVVNPVFARKIFGSVNNAIGAYYKLRDGSRIQVVGIVEDGKYNSLTENPTPAMFFPILQAPTSSTWLVVRSSRDPLQLGSAIRSTLHDLDAGLPIYIQTRYKELDAILFGARMATMALGVLGLMGAMLAITGIFGMAAYSVSKRLRELGIRIALGAERKQVLHAALGRAFKLLALGSAAGLLLGILASRVLAFIVYSATPRDPIVLAGAVLTMSLLGLLATWIPAQRALSVDPLILLREE
ncbi:MAG: ABC transporter substrate-binding protein [Acidobacteria bacterium]|nr:MAG: ABC transporter substrate-binding protein [Acidobacteriota bacterium]